MKCFRFIISGPSDGYTNMSLDEAIFECFIKSGKNALPALRIYSWKEKCITIGYFQKYREVESSGTPVVRRVTGGLAVRHFKDISYCLVTDSSCWPYVYNQEKSYEAIHMVVHNSFKSLGITTEIYSNNQPGSKNSLCTKTFFKNDLTFEGKKILGSCQRRRGGTLIQQGSIHVPVQTDFLGFSESIRKNFQKTVNANVVTGKISIEEEKTKDLLSEQKYTKDSWNKMY